MSERYEFFIKDKPMLPEPYNAASMGLPNVWLLNGVEFTDRPSHGPCVAILNTEELTDAIGHAVATKRTPLSGDEMLFLRKRMGLKQADLAKLLRVTEQTILNYEKGKTEAGPADVAIRVLYLVHREPSADAAAALRQIAAAAIETGNRLARRTPARAGQWHEFIDKAA
jgi:DNA-binding transcriptional regulator YiaG